MSELIKPSAPPVVRMLDRHFGVASFMYNRWAALLTEAQTLDDALSPQFWALQSEKIMGYDKANPKGLGDIIEIRKPDTGLYAELIITEIAKGFVRVAPIRAYEPKEVAIPDESPLTTRWNVGRRCHEVVRKADNNVMATGFQTKDRAVDWIVDHIKKLAA